MACPRSLLFGRPHEASFLLPVLLVGSRCCFFNHPCDVTILRSLPAVGRIVLATLLAEASDALHRRDYHALRCLSGVAPITKRSGKSRIVIMRQAVHVRLRNSVYHWTPRRRAA